MSDGLTFTRQPPVSPFASLTADKTAHQLWSELAGKPAFWTEFANVLTSLDVEGDNLYEIETELREEFGVTAMDGVYAGMLTSRGGENGKLWDVLELHSQIGGAEATLAGWHLDMKEVLPSGPLAVLDAADWTPTIAVRVTNTFGELKHEHRKKIIWLLAELSRVADVRVVATGLWQRRLYQRYREELPISESEVARRQARPPVEEIVEQADAKLNPDSREVEILRRLREVSSETLPHSAIKAEMQVEDSRISQCIGDLEEIGLIGNFPTGRSKSIELREAGSKFVELLNQRVGRQERLSELFSESRKRCDDSRVNTRARDCPAPPDGGDDGDWRDGIRPSDLAKLDPLGDSSDEDDRDEIMETEASATEGSTDYRTRLPSYHQVTGLSRHKYAAIRGCAPETGVAVVDHPVEEKDDRGEPEWFYEKLDDTLVVGGEYDNPLQWWVCSAMSLTSENMWKHVLTPERIEDGKLGDLLADHADLLRDSRCLGYLSDECATPEAYIDALREAREELGDMTREYRHGEYENRNRFRGDILRNALGLSSTVIHALDLAGVDVIRKISIPRYSKDFDAEDVAALLKTVAIGASIQSCYGENAAYRQLFEPRKDKRTRSTTAKVDAEDPFGELIGSFVITAPNIDRKNEKSEGEESVASEFVQQLRRRLANPAEVHDDAPEFGIQLDVKARPDRGSNAQTARIMGRYKNLSMTREAVSTLGALSGTPFDVARAIHNLAPETKAPGRNIRLSEIRVALRTLAPKRILSEMDKPALSKIVHTLLMAETGLDKQNLAARADVSERSVGTHIERLQAFGLVEESAGGYRLCLSFDNPEERHESIMPWFVEESKDANLYVRDVFAEVVYRLIDDPERVGDPDDPVAGALFGPPEEVIPALSEAWEWLDPWKRLVEIGVGRPAGGTQLPARQISFGVTPKQTPISDADGEVPG